MLRHSRSPAVVGTVSLWGSVVEHLHGWRAARAYPQRLELVCHVCASQGDWTFDATDVARYRDKAMVPFCASHLRLALTIGRRPVEIISAGPILSALTDAYAVDRLAAIPA